MSDFILKNFFPLAPQGINTKDQTARLLSKKPTSFPPVHSPHVFCIANKNTADLTDSKSLLLAEGESPGTQKYSNYKQNEENDSGDS